MRQNMVSYKEQFDLTRFKYLVKEKDIIKDLRPGSMQDDTYLIKQYVENMDKADEVKYGIQGKMLAISSRANDKEKEIAIGLGIPVYGADQLPIIDITAIPSTSGYVKQVKLLIEKSGGYEESDILEYSLDNVTWKEVTTAVEFTSNGILYTRLRASDNTIKVTNTKEIKNIDNEAPSKPVITAIGKKSGYMIASGSNVAEAVELTVTSNDTSGISKYEYSIDGVTWNEVTQGESRNQIIVAETINALIVRSYDNVYDTIKNKSENSDPFNVTVTLVADYGENTGEVVAKYDALYTNKSGSTPIPMSTTQIGNYYINSSQDMLTDYLKKNGYKSEQLTPQNQPQAGAVAYTLTKRFTNTWIQLTMQSATGRSMSVKFIFEDGKKYSLKEMLENNYIEPMLLYYYNNIDNKVTSIPPEFFTGSSLYVGRGSVIHVLFRVKDVSIEKYELTANKWEGYYGSGIYPSSQVHALSDLVLSLSPMW